MKSTVKPATIDAYIAAFPEPVQERLEKIRKTIAKAAPGATEAISYRIPTFKLAGKYLVYFAGFREHIGVYPVHEDTIDVRDELTPYLSGKATLKFPMDKPVPYPLIAKVVKAKVKAATSAPAKKSRSRA
ncbi:iron chaperone [Usitatibacter palustris]|uniref:YdhG-like domain-containing protein n=1 Tax=Usitatibacter palustris TaxID=2732487 RepID=A0A6M4H8P6_9PROT|nr:DUF1801 domain-containing protein [Usitatibacter palustris]QJR15093.1 hypothetical protein DSM104440_01909 [Usitatibacter palustris]